MKKLLIIPICLLMLGLYLPGCQQKISPLLAVKQRIKHPNTFKELKNYDVIYGRNDDISFEDHQKGWALNNRGKLSKTENAGKYWHTSFTKKGSYFRSLTFKDSLNGWLGTIGTDQNSWVTDSTALYRTKDGGLTWSEVEFDGPRPKGICGLQVVSDRMIVGSGRVLGPPFFIKSMDGGDTWKSYDMRHVAGALITSHFFDEMNGLMIGGTKSRADKKNSRGLILSTSDGGVTWDTVHITSQKNEWCWKISFPTRETGYISVQHNEEKGKFYFLKTLDGGKTWVEKEFEKPDADYFVQAIGFADEKIGWIGGGANYSYETRDGGETWYPIPDLTLVNRIIFTGPETGYASGSSIYRLDSIGALPSGKELDYYREGSLKSETEYVDGAKYGKSTEYYRSGQKKSEGFYEKNLKVGKWKFWSEKGQEKELFYRNDVAQLDKKTTNQLLGIYRDDDYKDNYVILKRKKGKLFLQFSSNGNSLEIYPITDDTYRFADRWNIEFKLEETEEGKLNLHHMYNDKTYNTYFKLSEEEKEKVQKELRQGLANRS
ncbi:MAG: hypothetical protein WBA74_17025 [Cyclobacteriaceae bacterium]